MLADTSVLRAFAVSQRLDMLRAWEPLFTTHRVVEELGRATNPGPLAPVFEALADGWLEVIRDPPDPVTRQRVAFLGGGDLSATDIELVALAHALAWPLLMHDRKATSVARTLGVQCRDLAVILEALKRLGRIPTREAMLDTLFRLESFDGQTFRPPVRARLLRF